MADGIGCFLDRWSAAEQSGDTRRLETLLTGDFAGIGPLGFTLSRIRELARHGLAHEHRAHLPAGRSGGNGEAPMKRGQSTGRNEIAARAGRSGQNGPAAPGRFTMPGMLPLRDTDPSAVGVYRLLGRLGEGGQGVVFLADSPAGSRAAVKLLPPTTNPHVRSRFLKEVAAAQRVARFCTAQVLDAGIFERRPFIVSEYVDGPSLVEVVEQLGPRRGAALERVAVATLTALGAVHAAGMVHRDIKPANVLLGPDGPVVIDFGLATVPGMTTTGLSGQVAIGTPAFMAPEQLAGERVTAAADMWSWGAMIAFAGTGRLPFTRESLTATAFAILHSDPQVGRLPEPLGPLIHRCLSKDPALRPSARQALSELVAAGARLLGPIPPTVSDLAADEKTASSKPAPAAPRELWRGSGHALTGGGRASRLRPGPAGAAGPGGADVLMLLTLILLATGAGGLAFTLSRRGASPEWPARGQAGVSQHLPVITAVKRRLRRLRRRSPRDYKPEPMPQIRWYC
jgi:serine/threonine protein kinase